MFSAAARPRRVFAFGPSIRLWGAGVRVNRGEGVPASMPNSASSTFATGVMELVVQEAFEITSSPSYSSWLTP